MLSDKMRWLSYDILSRLQGTPQITLHKRHLNLICYAQEILKYKGFTCSASDENGQIANAIWYLSLIPYRNVHGKRSLCLYPSLLNWCNKDDSSRRETQKIFPDKFLLQLQTTVLDPVLFGSGLAFPGGADSACPGATVENHCSRAGV